MGSRGNASRGSSHRVRAEGSGVGGLPSHLNSDEAYRWQFALSRSERSSASARAFEIRTAAGPSSAQ